MVTLIIGGYSKPNVLIELGENKNVITTNNTQKLGMSSIQPTNIVLKITPL